jgi:hypothetical protein
LINRALRDYPTNSTLAALSDDLASSQHADPMVASDLTVGNLTMQSDGKQNAAPMSKRLVVLAVIVALVLAGASGFWFYQRPSARISLTFEAYRDPLIYHVALHDHPGDGTHFVVAPHSQRYIFYDTYVKYTRVPSRPAEHILIAVITDPVSYPQWVRKTEVLYREIIGVDPTDAQTFDVVSRQIQSSHDAASKLATLGDLIQLEVRINGYLLELEDFSREPFGYVLSYKNPAPGKAVQQATYEFRCRAFQPRTLKNFPFIVSELARSLDYRLDYSDVSINNPEYFSAFVFTGQGSPEVSNDVANKVLTVRSSSKEWNYPGGGIFFYWQ